MVARIGVVVSCIDIKLSDGCRLSGVALPKDVATDVGAIDVPLDTLRELTVGNPDLAGLVSEAELFDGMAVLLE